MAVDDADAVAARAQSAGAEVVMAPTDMGDVGRGVNATSLGEVLRAAGVPKCRLQRDRAAGERRQHPPYG